MASLFLQRTDIVEENARQAKVTKPGKFEKALKASQPCQPGAFSMKEVRFNRPVKVINTKERKNVTSRE